MAARRWVIQFPMLDLKADAFEQAQGFPGLVRS
jgi:hypothetical protein